MWSLHNNSYFVANLCSSGSVRLTDGLIPTEGTVEVCNNGAWNSVCDGGWGYQEAFVVCRQLGLPATGKTTNQMHYLSIIQMLKLYCTIIYLDMDMELQHSLTGDVLEMNLL